MSGTASDRLSLKGRTALVTGAGRGLGRAEALGLAAAGARVVVNDFGGGGDNPADEVVAEILAAGGEAVAHDGDVSDWATAERLVGLAVESFGSLDVVVNNAGVLRDRLIFNISETEWDTVIRVHLKGHAAVSRFATAHWREQSKAAGGPVYARIVNTASEAFLFGSAGQPNYAAAKAGITALTVSTAQACARYGVKANVICPRARTDMTTKVFGETWDGQGEDPLSAEHVAPLVAFLASPAAEHISGHVFVTYGGMVALVTPPGVEKRFDADGRLSLEHLDATLGTYFGSRDGAAMFRSEEVAQLT